MNLLVMAKAPVPGRVKTRLCPPCSAQSAAHLAEAALADTLAAAVGAGADRCVLVLDGQPGPWLPSGVDVVPQRGDGFGVRLANAWSDVGGPGVQIGMDTPQVTGAILGRALDQLDDQAVDALLGDAVDGGWWAIGLRVAHLDAFVGVPMSRADTGEAQRLRLCALGLRIGSLPVLRDVDTFADAEAVAALVPGSRFATAFADALVAVKGMPDKVAR